MSLSVTGHQRSLAPIGVAVARLVTSMRCRHRRKPEDQLRQNLERIAVSTPHLLSDIGFVRDPKASSSLETIWVNGSLRLSISSQNVSVSVHQS